MMSFDFRCPAVGCEYEADTFPELRGHINGSRETDENHAELPTVRKHQFRKQ